MIDEQFWDAICIGSGIAGLVYSYAIMRRNPGLRILLLEKHDRAGGYASEFMRPKIQTRFDCSLHKLSGMGENGNLYHAFRELDLLDGLSFNYAQELCEAIRIDPQTQSPLCLDISIEHQKAFEQLMAAFPEERAGLEQFFAEVEVYGYPIYMQHLAGSADVDIDIAALRHAKREFGALSVADALAQRIGNPHLREILALSTIYVGAFPEQLEYGYFLHLVYACLSSGCAYIEGGAQRLSNLLVERIQSCGGKVLLTTPVEKITFGADLLPTGVLTKRGFFGAPHIIINAAPSYAISELLPPDIAPKLASPATPLGPTANSTTTIYLALDRPPHELGLGAAETMILAPDPLAAAQARGLARAQPENEALAEAAFWSASTIEVTNYHSLDPSGGFALVVNALDSIEHWPVRKTPAYKEKKLRAMQQLLGRLYQAKPLIQNHVIYTEVSSPRTYLRYTNNPQGSGYATLVAPTTASRRPQRAIKLQGITMMSAWVAGSGYEACIGYATQHAKHFRPSKREVAIA